MSANEPPGPGPSGPHGTQVIGAVPDMRAPAGQAGPVPQQTGVAPHQPAAQGQAPVQGAAGHAFHPAAQGQAPMIVAVAPAITAPPVPGAAERLRSFRRQQVYEATAPVGALIDDLGHIEAVDSRAESQQRWLGRLAWLLGPAAVLLTATGIAPVLFQQVEVSADVFAVATVVAMVVAIVLMVAFPFVRRRWFPVISQPSGDPTWLKVLVALAGFGLAIAAWPILAVLPEAAITPALFSIVLVGALAIVLHRRRRRHNTEDRRYQLAQALLPALARDVDPVQPVGLRLDLRPPNVKDKLVSSEKVEVFGGAARIGKFVDPWLELKGRFLDGTRFVLTFSEHTTVKNVVKGRKNKFKTKTKHKDRASLELRVKPGKLPALAQIGRRGRGALQLSPGSQLRKFDGSGERLFVEVGFATQGPLDEMTDGHWLSSRRECALQLFLGLYQVIHAAKKLRTAA